MQNSLKNAGLLTTAMASSPVNLPATGKFIFIVFPFGCLGYALLARPLSPKASSIEKQPVQTACFEEVFLDFLRLRFEFEPLPLYVMAAIHLCDEASRNYPNFVRVLGMVCGWVPV